MSRRRNDDQNIIIAAVVVVVVVVGESDGRASGAAEARLRNVKYSECCARACA